MSVKSIPVAVNIMDKEYRIGCNEGEQEGLFSAARYLDSKMREIKASGKIIGTDRIAVIAALNITHEFLEQQQTQTYTSKTMEQRLKKLQVKIDEMLDGNPSDS